MNIEAYGHLARSEPQRKRRNKTTSAQRSALNIEAYGHFARSGPQRKRRNKTTSAQRSALNTEAYRHKSTNKNSKSLALLKKSPRGVQRGRGFAAPLRFSKFPNLNKPPRSSGISPAVKREKRQYETKRKTILMRHPHRKSRRHHPSSTKNSSGSGLNRCGGYPQQHKTSESF